MSCIVVDSATCELILTVNRPIDVLGFELERNAIYYIFENRVIVAVMAT